MHTQNVNTAAQESFSKMGGKPVKFLILHAEWQKSAPEEEAGVMEFDSLRALSAYRKRCPEKMSMGYQYTLSNGFESNGFTHRSVVDAAHYKQFVRAIKKAGLEV